MSLGVIGGLGPMATAYFMQLVIKMTNAKTDQEHLDMIIYNAPTVPDRTDYILGKSKDNPLPKMIELGRKLREQNVRCIAIPCITAHYFHKELEDGIGVDIIHGIRETAKLLKESGVNRVGIMATDGTVSSKIFQREIEQMGMEAVVPRKDMQCKVMNLIYEDVKKGNKPNIENFFDVKKHLIEDEKADVIVLGCTELSVIKRDYDLGDGVLDAMEVLAKEAVKLCGKQVNPQYDKLFIPLSI
jgi:aspartate racemase